MSGILTAGPGGLQPRSFQTGTADRRGRRPQRRTPPRRQTAAPARHPPRLRDRVSFMASAQRSSGTCHRYVCPGADAGMYAGTFARAEPAAGFNVGRHGAKRAVAGPWIVANQLRGLEILGRGVRITRLVTSTFNCASCLARMVSRGFPGGFLQPVLRLSRWCRMPRLFQTCVAH